MLIPGISPTDQRARLAHAVRSLWAVPAVRWAAFSTAFFGCALIVQVIGGPRELLWGCYLGCYLAGGWQPALDGMRAARERTLDVDLLMIVAAIGAAAVGQVFDGALLIVIFATSGALEDVATRRTADSVRALLDLAPAQATRLDDDENTEVIEAADLVPGDTIVVRPGEMIAADGTVVQGHSEVDQSSITGEPMPVPVAAGRKVFAGTLNGTGALHMRVDTAAHETVVARIVAMVAQASSTKAGAQLFIEKVERVYSVVVVVTTVALFSVSVAVGSDLHTSLLRAMTLMIVASPCAIVLATMPPLLSAMATAGRNGVLVKSAVAMEHLADITTVALDKTGTLTTGQPQITHIVPVGDRTIADVLALAASVERFSEHPLGRAITHAARQRGLPMSKATHLRALPGHGIRAMVSGSEVEISSAETPSDLPPDADRRVGTRVAVRHNGQTVGHIVLEDLPRDNAAHAVKEIAAICGSPAILLTGDNRGAGQHVAAQVGITDVRTDLLPRDKTDAVTSLRDEHHRVALVGDGINDAPALAAADVGIAMGGIGADLSVQAADVVVVGDDISAVPAVLALARRARRVVIANLTIAATFIVVLVAWDLVGHLPLPLGVAGHEGSTILVALNGLRLLRRGVWSAPY